MGAIGNVIGKAVDAVTDTHRGTTLQDFLAQFSSSDGVLVKTIDPYASFDVSIKFYPSPSWSKTKENKDWLGRLTDSLASSAKSAVKNAANNLTGGLIGSLMNSKVDVMKLHNDNKDRNGYTTFLEYLAAANLLVGQEDWIGEKAGQAVSPLELQLGPYCQAITLPNMEVTQSGTSTTALGEFPINGTFVKVDTNLLLIKIINTRVPLHERIFYPWMRETVLPFWSYNTQPYTTATVTVDFTEHNDVKYVFYGCRPSRIMMQQATQQADDSNLTRDVSLLFDCMFIESNLDVAESFTSKLLSTGKTLLNSATKMMKA